nr:NEDD4-binding protein 2-like [Leptinotarsa decemlineata]
MLFDAFPTIAQNVLLEVLYAHNDSYKETVETLLATTGYKNVNDSIVQVEGAPIREDVLHEMKVAQQINGDQEYGDRQDASFHRAEAKKYFEKRCELFDMAQQYHRHGLTEAAQFFFGLSSLQSEYLVRANAMAVTAILNEHSRRLQDFNTLDLHFLYVKEAISALDVFLDRNISLLKLSQQRTHEYLQIITGRGNRSENGICKIKPAVKARLKERNIDCVELNPGRLKVRITKGSKVASELSKT